MKLLIKFIFFVLAILAALLLFHWILNELAK
jgi:hypothetical protein